MRSKKYSLLWQLDQDTFNTSYVYGTMHVKDQRAFLYQDLVFDKIRNVDAFAAEFNIDEIRLNANASSLDLPQGQSLYDILPAKKMNRLAKKFESSTGLPMTSFASAQPLMLINILSETVLARDMPFSLDETLWVHATEQGKVTLGIETLDEQIAIFQKIPLKLQLKALMWTVNNFKKHKKQLLKMTDLYQAADIYKMKKMAKKGAQGMKKILLTDRNIIMADRIDQMAQEQSLMAAIGAGHLAGQKGVLRLLKQKGWTVQPVSLETFNKSKYN